MSTSSISNPRPSALSTSAFMCDLTPQVPPPLGSYRRFSDCEANLIESCSDVQDIFTIGPIAIKYRNGVAASEIFRGGRRGPTLRPRGAQAPRGSARAVPPGSGSGGGTRLQIVRTPPARREVEYGRQAVPGGCAADSSGGKR